MYPSKILLFGEYSILLGSDALAIPYSRFNGEWALIKDFTGKNDIAIASNQNLRLFVKQVRWMESTQNINLGLDVTKLTNDVENGLWFNSDIPMSAGLGSSGALVAAIFAKYAFEPFDFSDLSGLKKTLARLESIYHGTSSGIDPLVSYLNSPILVTENNTLERISNPINEIIQKRGLFLVDSGNKGKTNDLVGYFNRKCHSDKEYSDKLRNHYIPLNNQCINEILKAGDETYFFSLVRDLSRAQLSLFEKMISEEFVNHMNVGIENNLFYLKLCGSGGGFILGFSQNITKTREYFDQAGYEILIF